MNRPYFKLCGFLLASFSVVSSGLAQAPQRIFSVNDAVFYGLKNNQQVLIANEDVEIAKARIRETLALNFPKVDFNFNASQYETMSPFVLPYSLGSVYYPPNAVTSSNYAARFSVLQYLYAGGKYTSSYKMAKTNFLISEMNREIQVFQAKADIKKAFYELIHAKQKFKLYKEEINALDKLNDARYNEWLRELKRQYFDVSVELENAKLNFLSKIGLELDTAFDVTGTLEVELGDYELSKLLAWANQYRKEINMGAIQETIDALSVTLLQSEKYPAITLGGTYEFLDVNLAENKKNWAMYLNLNLPIFDGWASWSRLAAKKSQAKQSGIKKIGVEDAIALEVRSSYAAYNISRQKVKFDEENLKQAGESPDKKKVFMLKLNLINSRLDAIINQIQLEKAVGKELM